MCLLLLVLCGVLIVQLSIFCTSLNRLFAIQTPCKNADDTNCLFSLFSSPLFLQNHYSQNKPNYLSFLNVRNC